MEATTEAELGTETKAIQVATKAPLVVKTARAMVMAQALDEEREQRELLKRYVSEFMIEGEDYGTIPGVKKRSLFKPGAEKLTDLFRCRPEYEIMAKEVNHETGLFYYEIRCRAVNRETETILNEGVGSASSYESKYRYRNAGRVCPHCGKDSIIKGRAEYGGGWICFAKKGGCGAKWGEGATEIEDQQVGKIQNPDLADVANVVLKMAKKRAQVDCAIALARVSDLFTQDVEDLVDVAEEAQAPITRRPAVKRDAPKAEPIAHSKTGGPGPSWRLWARIKKEHGEARAKEIFSSAAKQVFGATPKASNAWTVEETAQVEAVVYPEAKPLDDVPGWNPDEPEPGTEG